MLKKILLTVLCAILIVFSILVSGCETAAKDDATATPTDSVATPTAIVSTPESTLQPQAEQNSDGLRRYVPPHELLTHTIEESYLVIRAKYIGSENRKFEFLELIMGDEKTIEPIQTTILDNPYLYAFTHYSKDQEYILFIDKGLCVTVPGGSTYYVFNSAYAQIKPDEKISFWNDIGEQLDVGIDTIDGLKSYIAQIKPLDKNGKITGIDFERTGKLENVVAYSTYIIRAKVLQFERENGDGWDIWCEALDVIKGEGEKRELSISTYEKGIQVGKEYLFMLTNYGDPPDVLSYREHSAAQENSAIPIEDTERVNRVYELLGKQKP